MPMVLEMVLESLFAVVDVFWVGRLGADAMATVGLTESVFRLVFAVGIGLSMSTTAMVARRMGEKIRRGQPSPASSEYPSASSPRSCRPSFLFPAPRLLELMGATPAISPLA